MSDDRKRIETLEWTVRRLAAEVAALRAAVESGSRAQAQVASDRLDGPRREEPSFDATSETEQAVPRAALPDERPPAFPPAPPPAGAPPPRRSPDIRIDTRGVDLESLVGRYGAMLLAALTILLGVGAFIGWAVEHVQLGPRARVLLGALGASGVAALGEVLRRRGARSFGNSLLALALALVHLVAWGAGPSLGVIPVGVALATAIVASVALSLLAIREGEELLFVVGLVGSLVAPFAFAGPEGNLWALFAFGFALRAAAMHAIRDRSWGWAERTLAAGASAYALATLAVAGAASDERFADRLAPALFTLACMGSALHGGRGGRNVAVADAVTLAVVVGILGQISDLGVAAAGLGLAGVALGYLALARGAPDEEARGWIWSLALPAGLLLVALASLDRAATPTGAGVALAWSAAAAGAALLDIGRARSAHAFLAGATSTLAIGLGLSGRRLTLPVALATHAVVLAAIALRVRVRSLAGSAWLALAGGWLLAQGELMHRLPWRYDPFATRESLVMLAVVVAAVAAAWATIRLASEEGERELAMPAAAAAPIIAFFWGRAELAGAWAPETATFLLIAYYAATGTVALLVGRRLGRTLVRRAGLGLAIFAALKALVEAAGLSAVSLRIGSYLLVGCFLLAVAYWYRGGRGGEGQARVA